MVPEIQRFPLVIAPGMNNSGPGHRQTYWELSPRQARPLASTLSALAGPAAL